MIHTTTTMTWRNAAGRELVSVLPEGQAKVHPLSVNEEELRALAAACIAAADALAAAELQRLVA